jgi:hypothetical protein
MNHKDAQDIHPCFHQRNPGRNPLKSAESHQEQSHQNEDEKDHGNHNAKSSIHTRNDSQELACRPNIHPSQQISHEALMLA